MSLQNCYITRADFIKWIDSSTATDTNDDAVIDIIIESASRYCDDTSGRRFYPFRKTRKYDIPDSITREADKVFLDDDLLEVYSFTNGDLTDIPSADYLLYSVNDPPYWAIGLRDITDVTWELNSDDSSQQVLALDGLWGYRPDYDDKGWTQVGTLGAAMSNTTGLSATLTAGHTAVSGQIWKVESEIFQGTVATNAVTIIERGDNGTTAATHSNGTAVYMWNVYKQIQQATFLIANSIYKARFGENVTGIARVTAAGVVITPQDVPQLAQRILSTPPIARLA